MATRDPIRSELESFDEVDLPELGPEWDALAAGGPAPLDAPPLGEAARDALQPLDPALVQRIAHFAPVHYRKAAAPARSRFAWWALPALLSAAVAALIVFRPGPDPLPPYQAEWRSGAMEVRGAPGAPTVGCSERPDAPRFVSGSRFEVVLAPATAAEGAQARLQVDGARTLQPDITAAGVVHLLATAGRPPLDLAAGWHCLVADLGPGQQRIELGFWFDASPL